MAAVRMVLAMELAARVWCRVEIKYDDFSTPFSYRRLSNDTDFRRVEFAAKLIANAVTRYRGNHAKHPDGIRAKKNKSNLKLEKNKQTNKKRDT